MNHRQLHYDVVIHRLLNGAMFLVIQFDKHGNTRGFQEYTENNAWTRAKELAQGGTITLDR